MKAIAQGLKKLQDEEQFWNKAVKETRSEKSLDLSLAHHRNAARALAEFKVVYKEQLETIEKYPFLAK